MGNLTSSSIRQHFQEGLEWQAKREAKLAGIRSSQQKPKACEGCPLFDRPFVGHMGAIRTAGLIVLGEAPGYEEAMSGAPFVGRAGMRLRELWKQAQRDLDDDIQSGYAAVNNVLKCQPKDNKLDAKWKNQAIEHCRNVFLRKELTTARKAGLPKVILAFGNTAMLSLTNLQGIHRLHGMVQESDWLPKVPIVPTFHPAFLLRDPGQSKFAVKDLVRAFQLVKDPTATIGRPKQNTAFEIADTIPKVKQAYEDLRESEILAFDTETTSLTWYDATILCATFSKKHGTAWVIPLQGEWDEATQAPKVIWEPDELKLVKQVIKRIIESPRTLVGHNIKFDLLQTHREVGIDWWKVADRIYDTQLIQGLVDENIQKGLEDCAVLYTDMGNYKAPLKVYLDRNPRAKRNFAHVPTAILYPYAASDADATRRIFLHFWNTQQAWIQFFIKRTQKQVISIAEAEWTGAPMDTRVTNELQRRCGSRMDFLLKRMKALTGKTDFNPNSYNHVSDYLFKTKGYEPVYFTEGNKGAIDFETLEVLRGEVRDSLIQVLQDYRKLKKMSGTYLEGFKKMLAPHDGRLHTDFNMSGTRTGRWSSSRPNLQNLPKRDVEFQGIHLREIMAAPKEWRFVTADYRQIEVHMEGILAGDAKLLGMLQSGGDIHTLIASEVLDKKPVVIGTTAKDCTGYGSEHSLKLCCAEHFLETGGTKKEMLRKPERSDIKQVTFGILYGASERQVMAQTGRSEDEVRDLMSRYWDRLPGVKDHVERVKALIKKQFYLETPYGRRRRFPEGIVERSVEGHQDRQAVNFGPQSCAAEMLSGAFARIQERLVRQQLKGRIIIQVHDQIISLCPREEVKPVARIMAEEMLRPSPEMGNYIFPIEIGVGRSWYEAEGHQRKVGTFRKVT
jgi:DNA polymerase-1